MQKTFQNEDNLLSIKELCALCGVSRSGYYRFLSAPDVLSERESRDLADFQLILEAYQFRGYDKGVGNLHAPIAHGDSNES